MDETAFRKRVYANPQAEDQEVLEAAGDNPDYRKILYQTRRLDSDVSTLVNSVEVPTRLKEKLLAIPHQGRSAVAASNEAETNSGYFQYFALAASLLLAIGLTFSLTFNRGTGSGDLALGNSVIAHIYTELGEINAISNGSDTRVMAMPAINEILADSGSRLLGDAFFQSTPVRSAKPCEILPAYQSGHLIIQGMRGAVSVIVINNSPVNAEYSIRDERFAGMVIPMGEGNMILVGEQGEDLELYKDLFAETVEWVIRSPQAPQAAGYKPVVAESRV